MKPDWKDAPEWANWLAMDDNGSWNWYEHEPEFDGRDWWISRASPPSSRYQRVGTVSCLLAEDSLSRRPQTTKPAEAGSEGQGA